MNTTHNDKTRYSVEQRIQILNNIFSDLQQITQWLPNNIDFALQYVYQAKSLIEELEVDDCGSVGGYDRESPVIRESGFYLYDRFLALVRKYHNENDIVKCCQFDLDTLKKYFRKLSRLRDSYLGFCLDNDHTTRSL